MPTRMMARLILFAALSAGLFAGSGPAAAQPYPNRPIKIVVPFPPGGPTDLTARLVADRMSSALGQSVIVESRPGGAGGTVGAKSVASSDPDGYTLLLALTGTLTISPAIFKNVGYDPSKSSTPVATIASSAQLLVANPGVAGSSLADLVMLAKSNPGKISYASPGYGTQPHLLGELLKAAAGIDIVHVPYKGSAPAITDLLAGQVQIMFDSPTVLLPHVEAGKLKPIAVTSETRARQLPQVPTVGESGFPKLTATLWSAIVAPAGTPPDIVARLNAAINDGLRTSEMRTSLARAGVEPKITTPQECAGFLSAEVRKWADVVKTANIKVE